MFRRVLSGSGKKKTGSVPVYLNVYDLTPINGYAYWVGLGFYHSGVQVNEVEYAFGAHEFPTTGIFEGEPKQCPGFNFRKSILIGRTDLCPKEVRALMEKLAEEYRGNTYNLITKNCNHFCNDACLRLTGKPIPRWINRLARIVKVQRHRAEDWIFEMEKNKLRSHSSRFVSSSSSSNSDTSGCVSKSGRLRRHFLPSSRLILSSSA